MTIHSSFFFCTCNITLYHNLDLEYACILKKKICLQETINWKVLHPNSSEFSMLVERKSVPNMLFGISVQTSPLFSNSRNWTSSGIKWNTCIYKKNGSEFLFFLKQREKLFQIYYIYYIIFNKFWKLVLAVNLLWFSRVNST